MIRKQVRPGRALAITALLVAGGSSAVADQQHVTLSPLVITAPPMSDPLLYQHGHPPAPAPIAGP